ncbi:MAG: hypothetical protein IT459_14855 [Planctomycetes bacterium]|nr:hypothetical protein [Planctomycetota bacterium]
MNTRAKFVCQSKKLTLASAWDGYQQKSVVKTMTTVELYPVTGSGAEENKQFFASTPSGKIELGLISEDAGALFELGKSYYVDFTKAD